MVICKNESKIQKIKLRGKNEDINYATIDRLKQILIFTIMEKFLYFKMEDLNRDDFILEIYSLNDAYKFDFLYKKSWTTGIILKIEPMILMIKIIIYSISSIQKLMKKQEQ